MVVLVVAFTEARKLVLLDRDALLLLASTAIPEEVLAKAAPDPADIVEAIPALEPPNALPAATDQFCCVAFPVKAVWLNFALAFDLLVFVRLPAPKVKGVVDTDKVVLSFALDNAVPFVRFWCDPTNLVVLMTLTLAELFWIVV